MRPTKRKPSRVYLLTTAGTGNPLPLTGELIDTDTHGPLVVFGHKTGLRCGPAVGAWSAEPEEAVRRHLDAKRDALLALFPSEATA